jgi:hypothetical protein
MAQHDPQALSVPISWVGYDEIPIVYANHFLIQYQPEDSFVIGIGQATMPALIGEPEEISAQAAEIEFIPVRPLSRIALTEDKMKELIAVLSASLTKAETLRQLTDPRGRKP